MDKNISELLFQVPPHITYTDILADVDLEDIPLRRILETEKLLSHKDEVIRFQSALLLSDWGNEKGFQYLSDGIQTLQFQDQIPHRLHPYDDTFRHILMAFMGYYATKADLGFAEQARKEVFKPICKIIEYSSYQSFEISNLFHWLTGKEPFKEYIEPLKQHLKIILQNAPFHRWKPYEMLQLLMEVEPDYVGDLLINLDKKIIDYKLYDY